MDPTKINRTEIAKALNIDIGHVSRIFSGKSNPSLGLAYRIARHLKVSLDELCQYLGIPDRESNS